MSDTRTIRNVLSTIACGRLGLDPDTVLERRCETCEGAGRIKGPSFGPMTRGFTLPPCPDCDGSGWITVNRIMVMPAWVADDGFRGFLLDPADQRALRIGRAVLASEAKVSGPGSTPAERGWNQARDTFLAAGDPDE